MRKVSLVIALVAWVLSGCGESRSPDQMTASQKRVQAYFKSEEEPSVKDAAWTRKNVFKVAMIPSGSKRNGFAQYVCDELVLRGYGGQGVRVDVVDVVQLSRAGKWVSMGEARCR